MGRLLPLLAIGCAGEYPQSTIHPQSEFADVIHSLYVSVFWWTMLILAVVWTALAYVLLKFREREGDLRPRQTRGHLGLEIGWTVVPALIVLAIAIPTIRAVFATQRPVADDALQVEVTGHRFWWDFAYPGLGVRTANELRLPVNRPVSLRLTSRDVIHSFWVPALGGKRDVAPLVAAREGEGEGKYTWLHFTPSTTGIFMGQCAEFCGEGHALMGLRVVVVTEGEFEAWSGGWADAAPEPAVQGDSLQQAPAQAQEDPLVAAGREAFFTQSTCAACHSIHGTPAQGQAGPDLTLFGSRTTLGAGLLQNTPENAARWITDPQGLKPGAEMPGVDYPLAGGTGPVPSWPATGLNQEQVAAVAAYLQSLR